MAGFDVIGDIHGHADALTRLLGKLNYRVQDCVYRHASRTVVFLGDFVDRGPHQREVLRVARAMVEAGAARAVMGNHEFNAIARRQGRRPVRPYGKEQRPAPRLPRSSRRRLDGSRRRRLVVQDAAALA